MSSIATAVAAPPRGWVFACATQAVASDPREELQYYGVWLRELDGDGGHHDTKTTRLRCIDYIGDDVRTHQVLDPVQVDVDKVALQVVWHAMDFGSPWAMIFQITASSELRHLYNDTVAFDSCEGCLPAHGLKCHWATARHSPLTLSTLEIETSVLSVSNLRRDNGAVVAALSLPACRPRMVAVSDDQMLVYDTFYRYGPPGGYGRFLRRVSATLMSFDTADSLHGATFGFVSSVRDLSHVIRADERAMFIHFLPWSRARCLLIVSSNGLDVIAQVYVIDLLRLTRSSFSFEMPHFTALECGARGRRALARCTESVVVPENPALERYWRLTILYEHDGGNVDSSCCYAWTVVTDMVRDDEHDEVRDDGDHGDDMLDFTCLYHSAIWMRFGRIFALPYPPVSAPTAALWSGRTSTIVRQYHRWPLRRLNCRRCRRRHKRDGAQSEVRDCSVALALDETCPCCLMFSVSHPNKENQLERKDNEQKREASKAYWSCRRGSRR